MNNAPAHALNKDIEREIRESEKYLKQLIQDYENFKIEKESYIDLLKAAVNILSLDRKLIDIHKKRLNNINKRLQEFLVITICSHIEFSIKYYLTHQFEKGYFAGIPDGKEKVKGLGDYSSINPNSKNLKKLLDNFHPSIWENVENKYQDHDNKFFNFEEVSFSLNLLNNLVKIRNGIAHGYNRDIENEDNLLILAKEAPSFVDSIIDFMEEKQDIIIRNFPHSVGICKDKIKYFKREIDHLGEVINEINNSKNSNCLDSKIEKEKQKRKYESDMNLFRTTYGDCEKCK